MTHKPSFIQTLTLIVGVALFGFAAIGGNAQSKSMQTPTPLGGGQGQIAFTSDRDGKAELYVMNSDGSNIRHWFNRMLVIGNPKWSRDEKQIAFTSEVAGRSQIFVVNSDGTNLHQVTTSSLDHQDPDWSPNGQEIAFGIYETDDYGIYVMNADGTNIHRLTDNSTHAWTPAWSPDGTQIAFGASSDGYTYELDKMGVDGSDVQRITNFSYGLLYTFPAWSPDGKQIAFTGNYTDKDGNGHQVAIYLINANGSNYRHVFINSQDTFYPVSWSPDGTQVVFSADNDPMSLITNIYIINVDGSNLHQLTDSKAWYAYPFWRP